MSLFDSAKKIVAVAKDSASELLGEEGLEAAKQLANNLKETGNEITKKTAAAWNNSDNSTIKTARELFSTAKTGALEEKTSEIITQQSSPSDNPHFVPALCTQCGASLSVDPSQEAAVCQYCGTPFVVSSAITKYNIEHADIHAEKVEIHRKGSIEATFDYLKERKRIHDEERRRKREEQIAFTKKAIPVCISIILVILIIVKVNDSAQKRESAAEEVALQEIVDQIQICMEEEQFEEALVKANSLYYTSGYSNSVRKKWDNTRASLIEVIEAAIQERDNMENAPIPSEAPIEDATVLAESTEIAEPEETVKPTQTPKPVSTIKPVSTPRPSVSDSSLSYTSNNRETAKQGNTGVYAYKKSGKGSTVYYIIDFDNGYVYTFTHGDGNTFCDRIKIVSGDLNNVLIITYHDGADSWSYGLHFKWKNQPDHLILQDNDGLEYEFSTTSLDKALQLRDGKTIIDY